MAADKTTIDRAWNQMYDIVRLSRYYANVGSIHSKVQMATQTVNLAASMGAVASLLEQWPIGMVVSGVAVALSAVVAATWNNPSRLAAILSASVNCRVLEIEAGRVWSSINSLSDEQATERWVEIAKQLEKATSPVEMAGVGFSSRQNAKATEEARAEMKWAVPASLPASDQDRPSPGSAGIATEPVSRQA